MVMTMFPCRSMIAEADTSWFGMLFECKALLNRCSHPSLCTLKIREMVC